MYLLRNKINGKCYVGQTVNLAKRFQKHRDEARHHTSGMAVGFAIEKYGWDAFEKYVLEQCSSPEELNAAEEYWIAKHNSIFPHGYNIERGGDAKCAGLYVGEKSAKAILNWSKVKRIRMMFDEGLSTFVVARIFNVSQALMHNIKADLSWYAKDMPEDTVVYELDESESAKLRYELAELAKGTQAEWYANRSGEKHCCAKLTWEKVREIRRRVALGELRKDLGAEYGVSAQRIGAIAANKSWRE